LPHPVVRANPKVDKKTEMTALPLYKQKVVEEIRLISKLARLKSLQRADFNPFMLYSEDIAVDLLTDSGTGALSQEQRVAEEKGDETYCGSKSWRSLERSAQRVLGFPYVIPVHQGRGAEHVVDFVLVKKGSLVPGNAHFDTTKANIEVMGGKPVDCTISEAYDPSSGFQFKGNIDLARLEKILKKSGKKIPYVLSTITCNQVGGQPVSMENLKKSSALCKKYGIRFFLDVARFAENAYFIKKREKGFTKKSIKSIIDEMMLCADGALMSAKKDALNQSGGLILLRDKKLFETLQPYGALFAGGIQYGAMSGKAMESLTIGLKEGIKERYLEYRIAQVEHMGNKLRETGVPIVLPIGGHAVFVNAGEWLPHIRWGLFPGHSLACALYLEGGVRGVEIGSLLENRDPKTHENRRAKWELLRLAIPHRLYTQEHLDYVANVFEKLSWKLPSVRGVEFVRETYPMRHFTSKFKLAKAD